jgi:predicted RNA-binding protein associated with RNAse of E/G family
VRKRKQTSIDGWHRNKLSKRIPNTCIDSNKHHINKMHKNNKNFQQNYMNIEDVKDKGQTISIQ